MAAAGIARTFQNIRLFRELSVLDNVRLAGQLRSRTSLVDTLVRTGRHHTEEEALCQHSLELLDLFELSDRADAPSAVSATAISAIWKSSAPSPPPESAAARRTRRRA